MIEVEVSEANELYDVTVLDGVGGMIDRFQGLTRRDVEGFPSAWQRRRLIERLVMMQLAGEDVPPGLIEEVEAL